MSPPINETYMTALLQSKIPAQMKSKYLAQVLMTNIHSRITHRLVWMQMMFLRHIEVNFVL